MEATHGCNGVGKSRTSKVVNVIRRVLTKGKTVTFETLNVKSFSSDLDRLEEYHKHASECLLGLCDCYNLPEIVKQNVGLTCSILLLWREATVFWIVIV